MLDFDCWQQGADIIGGFNMEYVCSSSYCMVLFFLNHSRLQSSIFCVSSVGCQTQTVENV